MVENWTYTPVDGEVSQGLQAFLPPRMFDVHAHLYQVADLAAQGGVMTEGPSQLTWETWRQCLDRQTGPGRCCGGLFFPDPMVPPERVDAVNNFLIDQLKTHPNSRGLIVIHPDYPRDRVQHYLEVPQIAGFKVYHTFSRSQPTFDASMESFVPEWAWQTANERGLVVMLHMVRRFALADSGNQLYLRDRCRRYPAAQLVLAHAARGFHAPNTRRGLPALKGLNNVWFDTSAVCEPDALVAILEAFGPRRLIWGSDFPVSQTRGKCVTLGSGFAWLQPDTVQWNRCTAHGSPTLVGLESLLALRQAAENTGLNIIDLQDIFHDNASRLLAIKPASGTETQDLYRHARGRIPGGTQLLSKRPEMLAPDQWPAYFREARGCEVWDLDGQHYFDMSTNGIGSCLLGFRDPDVTRAVRRRLMLGAMSTLNPPEEVALADRLCTLHPWAEQVRFGRSGGEAMAVAVRIARATTRRSAVAICGYHGWHDWYLAANLGETDGLRGHLLPGLDPGGVPAELRGTTVTFRFNSREDFQGVLDRCGHRLAALVMEPSRFHPPDSGFLELVRDGTHRCGALLIFDEITIGWRLCLGGAHLKLGVHPDMAVFAKALGNGHPMAAIIGTPKAMAGAHESFISSTYWTESIGPVATLATLDKLAAHDVPAHIARIGTAVVTHWQAHGARHGLPIAMDGGYPCLAHFRFDHPLEPELRTLYTQWMLERGFLAGCTLYPTLAHDDEVVAAYGAAIDEVFGRMAEALQADTVRRQLKGPVAHSGFKRLT
ncbi:MAG TPA: aminotransferase class III-fold pyridoxal phosphate-dependent enzyme [Phycisphaerae bacterium]|nr:aminotransferase class III-fold pyridoxal phosphate-dependent enzyme [Phycisphaerae bacterium]HRY70195.1 aminotransferase class III-fold pyridoxal phosphate-dependent enzyme [Phycisphaerae bacterium]HSA27410.1 aminotransferase class III-fold pyridoxal phosphate-dependent enzyme [Phycisphaerae bacterium]